MSSLVPDVGGYPCCTGFAETGAQTPVPGISDPKVIPDVTRYSTVGKPWAG